MVRTVSRRMPSLLAVKFPEVLHQIPPETGPMSICQVVPPVFPEEGAGSEMATRKGTSSEIPQLDTPEG